jgi:enamine deaminase RidA (YjgF/YER057c/UK114 family)
MRIRLPFIVILLASVPTFAAAPSGRYVKSGDVVVAATVPTSVGLLHTAQMLSPDDDPRISLLAAKEIVKVNGGDPAQLVKINVAAATPEIAERARELFASEPAAVSYVVGALPHGKKVGIDVVAIGRESVASSSARLLPAGPRVYISGQAEKGATPAEAAAKTLQSLLKTLESVGSSKDNVVQAKCFLTPMSAAPEVIQEIERVFGKKKLPFVFVEWKSDLPIEIEMIASAPVAGGNVPAIQYLTPAGMKGSPLFARVVRIDRGDVIYTSGLYGEKAGSGEEQTLSIFDQLQSILKQTNGDLKHLAKATYYVSNADASGKLNEIRPKLYDPQRPPAASKAMVPGVGMKDRSISIDMIGVVATDAPTTKPIKP